jgi:hypothetical protein
MADYKKKKKEEIKRKFTTYKVFKNKKMQKK